MYFYFKSFACALVAFCAGVLIDLDHILDFHVNHGIRNYKMFFRKILATDLARIFILLHSADLIIALWLCIIIFSLNKYWISLAIGVTQHILFDQFTNPIGPLGYFLIYRIIHKFKKEKIVIDDTKIER